MMHYVRYESLNAPHNPLIPHADFRLLMQQMLDMVRPEVPGKVSLADLKRCRLTPIFFDTFFNLDKYLDHEQKDPFASSKNDEEVSDWDKFAGMSRITCFSWDHRLPFNGLQSLSDILICVLFLLQVKSMRYLLQKNQSNRGLEAIVSDHSMQSLRTRSSIIKDLQMGQPDYYYVHYFLSIFNVTSS